MSEQVIIELIVLSGALLAGFCVLKRLTPLFLFLFIQLAVWMCFYSILHLLTWIQTEKGLPPNNQWLMNIHMVMETGLLYAAALTIKNDKVLTVSVGISAFIFSAVFITQWTLNGIEVYMNYADIAECITVTVLFIQISFLYSRTKKTKWFTTPELVAGLGLLLYFGGSVPYISMMHYLQKVNPQLNHLLFDFISNVLANVRYVLLAFGFVLIYRNNRPLKTQL